MISFARYATLLAQPRLRATIAASFLGRVPIGVGGLAILLFVQAASGSFARAGAAAALYVGGLACVAPLLGRLIDRSGPRPIAAASAFAGTLLFLRSPAVSGWRTEPRERASFFGPLGAPGFRSLLAVVLGYSAAFGLVEVGVTAYAAEVGQLALAGVLLGLMSAGSAAGGLAYGGRSWGAPLARQFVVVLLVMGSGIAPLALVRSEWLFAPLSLLAGIVMAPALIIQAMLVAKIAAPGHSTEAFTWASTALLAGVGLGTAGGGWLVERWGSPATFAAAALAAVLAGALASRLRDAAGSAAA